MSPKNISIECPHLKKKKNTDVGKVQKKKLDFFKKLLRKETNLAQVPAVMHGYNGIKPLLSQKK